MDEYMNEMVAAMNESVSMLMKQLVGCKQTGNPGISKKSIRQKREATLKTRKQTTSERKQGERSVSIREMGGRHDRGVATETVPTAGESLCAMGDG